MSLITKAHLSMATRMLSHRLTGPTKINVTLLDLSLETPSEMEEYFARYIGYFDLRPNGDPCFILMARSQPEAEIDHLFAFYIRTNYRKIQKSEVSALRKRLNSLEDLKSGVINIRTLAPKTCNLSILLQTVEFAIQPNLLNNFKPVQVIYTNRGSSSVCFNPNIPYPSCGSITQDTEALKVWDEINRLGLKAVHHRSNTLPPNLSSDFDILSMRYDNHLIYLIHHKEVKSVMFLLPHCTQFKCQEDSSDYHNQVIKSLSPYRIKRRGTTRFFGDFDTRCNSAIVVRACLLARTCGSNLFTCIKKCDVDAIIRPNYMRQLLNHVESNRRQAQVAPFSDVDLIALPYEMDDTRLFEPECELVVTDVRLDGDEGNPEVISTTRNQISSQETVIITEEEIKRDLMLYSHRRFMKASLESFVPATCIMPPMNCFEGEVLTDLDIYKEALAQNLLLWNGYTTVDLIGIVSFDITERDVLLETDHRFVVIPIVDDGYDLLFVVDKMNREYVYINPLNGLVPNTEEFKVIDNKVRGCCSALKNMIGRPITVTSVFHREYPRVHLLMAVFYLGRLFKHAVRLPTKIIYAEREFRRYCHEMYLELQLVNQKYNVDNKLLKKNGYLKADAYRSVSSPVLYERSVVPSNECPFCNKRKFNKLVQHIRMKHGGRSAEANLYRHGKV